MNKRTVTREYNQENGYGGEDGYQLYIRFVNDRPDLFKLGLKGEKLSTDAIKLLAGDLHNLAELIEADFEAKKG